MCWSVWSKKVKKRSMHYIFALVGYLKVLIVFCQKSTFSWYIFRGLIVGRLTSPGMVFVAKAIAYTLWMADIILSREFLGTQRRTPGGCYF